MTAFYYLSVTEYSLPFILSYVIKRMEFINSEPALSSSAFSRVL